MSKYIPSTTQWVAEQVELYEGSHGTHGTTLRGLPVIIVTNWGRRTGAIRKTPLMKVTQGKSYILVASRGGAPENPQWYYNLKTNPRAQVQDESVVVDVLVREVDDAAERRQLWEIAVDAYPPYQDYQEKTDRKIPVFLAEPLE